MGRGGIALVAFEGTTVDEHVADLVSDPRVAGVTLYRSLNIETAEQTRRLTEDLVAAAGRQLLIAVDQEGGQLLGGGPDTTPFAGNMALGATGDSDLAGRVAAAMAREMRALGINIDYAPVADVASRPHNPSLGIRSFGEDPDAVADFTGAFVTGLQGQGVAATLKHFPGKGEATVDPHDELPVLDLDLERLDQVEWAPFRAGIEAGARLLMVGHYGLPAVTGDRRLPTSVSKAVLEGSIRERLGFGGLVVTDALDMGGFAGMAPEAPLAAGADLLLYGPAQAGDLPAAAPGDSGRLDTLFQWLVSFPDPSLTVVGCEEHRRLADDLARRAITLVRDDTAMIPLHVQPSTKILAIMPRPTNLTPADTSEFVEPGLAAALRARHPNATEMVVGVDPSRAEVGEAVSLAREHDLVVLGTIDATPAQGELVQAVLATSTPTVAVALRTPYDLGRYPEAPAYLCSYGILPPSMKALADALFGAQVGGRLPVAIPGLYPIGHGMERPERP